MTDKMNLPPRRCSTNVSNTVLWFPSQMRLFGEGRTPTTEELDRPGSVLNGPHFRRLLSADAMLIPQSMDSELEPIADTGDVDIRWNVVQHDMAAPKERIIGVGRNVFDALADALLFRIGRIRRVFPKRGDVKEERLITTVG